MRNPPRVVLPLTSGILAYQGCAHLVRLPSDAQAFTLCGRLAWKQPITPTLPPHVPVCLSCVRMLRKVA